MSEHYKTGRECPRTGKYQFDGYLNGSWLPSPTPEEMEIQVAQGGAFPPIRSQNKACWWRPLW
jgi:hypothetical protein